MERTPSAGAVSAAQIRAAMFGRPVAGMRVVRQAWRVRGADSDELAIVRAPGGWWGAQRIADRLSVWAYPGEDEAEDGFERLMASTGGDWTEAAVRAVS